MGRANALTALDPRLLVLGTIISSFFKSRYNDLYFDEDEYEGVEEVILKDPIYKEEARAGTGGGEDTAPGPSTLQNLQDGASSTGSRRRYNEYYFWSCVCPSSFEHF